MLLGEDHPDLGEVTVDVAGPAAVGISRGRHPKAYPYLDPNEDAVLAVVTGERSLLVVADGHTGVDASHAAVGAVAEAAPDLMGLPGPTLLARLLGVASRAVTAATRDLPRPRNGSATALALTSIGPEGLASAAVADCVSVRLRSGAAEVLTDVGGPFLRGGGGAGDFAVARHDAHPGDLVVVASDGLIDFLPPPWESSLARIVADAADAEEAVRACIGAAGDGGGGDNVAVASLRVP